MQTLVADDIDFGSYLVEPEARLRVRPLSDWLQEVIDGFSLQHEQQGALLPWRKTAELFRLRRHELTLWPGINGHGKSLVLNQAMLCAAAQGERCLIASMEMRPTRTIERFARQALKCRRPAPTQVSEFHAWSDGRMWLYDQLGSVDWRKLIAVCRWAVDKLGITQIVIDSLMRCGIAETDYDGQKAFLDALCSFKNDNPVSVHLVMHSRKKEDEFATPGKFDAKGTGTMTDLADNVLTVWRNKKKEAMREQGAISDELIKSPDAMVICDKQRNFDWEGKIALWYERESMQFVEHGIDVRPMELMEFGA
jgi:twinkle protein